MITRIKNNNLAQLLIAHGIFTFGKAFLDIFMSVLIWNVTKDIKAVAIFQLSFLTFHTLSFFIFGGYVKKYNNVIIKNIGLFGLAMSVVLISSFSDFFLNNAYLIGLIIGIFNGMYWINYHVVKFDLTSKSIRAKYTGWENSTRIITNLSVPVIGGAMLVYLPGDWGSKSIFISVIFLYLLAMFFGNFKSDKTGKISNTKYLDTVKVISKDRQVVKTIIASMLGAFVRRGAFFTTLIPLLILVSVKNEFEFGNIISAVSIVAALSFIILGKRIKFNQYRKSLLLGISLQIFSIALVLVSPSLITFILYLAIQQLSLPFSEVPRKVIKNNMAHKLSNYKNHRVEYIAISEFAGIMLGRVPSYLLLLFFTDINSPGVIRALLGIMVVFIVIELFLLTSIPEEDYSD